MHPHNYTCTLSLLRVQPWFLFGSVQPLSSNATPDVLMLMLSLILSASCFFIPLSSVTERKPSRTVQTTGGLCANMIRTNRNCQTTNKDGVRQKETFRKRKQKHEKGCWMKRQIKGLREKRTNSAPDKRASSSRSDGWMSRGCADEWKEVWMWDGTGVSGGFPRRLWGWSWQPNTSRLLTAEH